jgi:hypothetical protein
MACPRCMEASGLCSDCEAYFMMSNDPNPPIEDDDLEDEDFPDEDEDFFSATPEEDQPMPEDIDGNH